jgi:hypothetical protein
MSEAEQLWHEACRFLGVCSHLLPTTGRLPERNSRTLWSRLDHRAGEQDAVLTEAIMTTPYNAPQPPNPAEVHLPDYVLVFSDQEPPPKEHTFTAISDAHAKDLMQREYPSHRWMLYRIDAGGQRQEGGFHF